MRIANALKKLLPKKIDPVTSDLYAACVAAARQPVFYASLGVPDTVDGRFDLLLLHVLMVIWRIKDTDAKQRLFDLMFADMDRSLREMGVGDMSIGKKMKPMLAGFFGRAGAYEAALKENTNDKLIATLSRNLYNKPEETVAAASQVATYIRRSVTVLAAQSESDLAAGRVHFPPVLG